MFPITGIKLGYSALYIDILKFHNQSNTMIIYLINKI